MMTFTTILHDRSLTMFEPDEPPVPARDRPMLTPEEFWAGLNYCDMHLFNFAEYTGANPRTVRRWADGERDIPPWVDVLLRLMARSLDNGLAPEWPTRATPRIRFQEPDTISEGPEFFDPA